MELEYRSISSEYLANRALEVYKVGHAFFYENVLHHKTFTISKPNDSVINEHVNVPRRSMTGLLFLFKEPFMAGTRDSEKFVNPDITSVKIDIDGVPNMLYARGMIPTDQYKSILQRFTGDISVKEKDFYTNDKFALWIDLRTHSWIRPCFEKYSRWRETRKSQKSWRKWKYHMSFVYSSKCANGDKEFKLAFNYVLISKDML